MPKETKKAKRQKTKQRTLNEALRQVESENSDEEEDVERAAIECIISALENVVIEWVSCESCCKWFQSKCVPTLSDKTPEQLNEMIFICSNC